MTAGLAGRPEPPGGPGSAQIVFTDRSGGVSQGPYESLNLGDHVGDDPAAVAANRARLAQRVGVAPADLAVMKAVHGREWAQARAGGSYGGVDILVTTAPSVAVAALAADCVTLALLDASAGVAGAAHSGWRGVTVDTVGAAVTAMVQMGADAARLTVRLGPAICPACYEVSEQVRDDVARSAPAGAAVTRLGTPSVALHAAVIEQLHRAGVRRIAADPRCTAESGVLYSYRRDGVTGRHGVAVRLSGDQL